MDYYELTNKRSVFGLKPAMASGESCSNAFGSNSEKKSVGSFLIWPNWNPSNTSGEPMMCCFVRPFASEWRLG